MRPPSLRTSRDFDHALRQGVRSRGNGLTIYVARQNEAEAPARLGLIVARVGGAVLRNRVRRRVREAFRSCNPRPGVDVVVRADARAAVTPFAHLVDLLRGALENAA